MANERDQNIDHQDALRDSFLQATRHSGEILRSFMSRNPSFNPDPFNIGRAFLEMNARIISDPNYLIHAQRDFWQSWMAMWQGHSVDETNEDRRFSDDAWHDHFIFSYIRQSYLLFSRWFLRTVHGVEGMDNVDARKVDFYAQQFIDAISPSNFLMTNPEVIRETLASKGQNLVRGFSNLIKDLERAPGHLSISMSDRNAFKIGKNIALSKGAVIFENDLMQLIHYAPSVKKVHRDPIVIVPPWINKYYILDLNPKKSFVRFALEQGLDVFMISWVNPDAGLRHKTFDDYLTEGVLSAIDTALAVTGAEKCHTVGYCIGGTLLAAALAHMERAHMERAHMERAQMEGAQMEKAHAEGNHGKKAHVEGGHKKTDAEGNHGKKGLNKVASTTFLATLVDFSDPGPIVNFIDEEQVKAMEKRMHKEGCLAGEEMAFAFNMLRSNDLIWSFVINNYLLGRDPLPFDLLFWNNDSTRMPEAMHSFYLRKMYLENRLIEKDAISLAGTKIDLGRITADSYFVATRQDHIAPWKSVFGGSSHFSSSKRRLVLSGSGHIAGIINPPQSHKYGYWTDGVSSGDLDRWPDSARFHQGSWWNDWMDWIKPRCGPSVDARTPGGHKQFPPIEDAPGRYVLA